MTKGQTLSKEEIVELVASRTWYHRYEVSPGVMTPGRTPLDAKRVLDCYGFPQDVTGKRVLEIGAWDGAYTFEVERRGGIVTAMDIQDKERTGFSVAHRINNSKVRYIQNDVTNLNPEQHGKYDIVLFLGVYYHILHPLLAFQNIYNVLNDDGVVFYSGHILEYSYKIDSRMAKYKKELMAIVDKIPITLFARGCHAEVWSNWYIPNLLCLNDWLATAGFKVFKEQVGVEGSTMAGAARKIPNFKLAPKWYDCRWSDLAGHRQELEGYGKILFFGAGGRFASLQEEIARMVPAERIAGVADNDPAKWGKTIAGHPIVNPKDIPAIKPDLVLVVSAFAADIFEALDELKLETGLGFEIVNLDNSEMLDTSCGHEVY
ncbi:MAG: methyltransferase domain-containing protein [Humidesulfovibrio sp.]